MRFLERFAFTFEAHKRHSPSARGLDALDVDIKNLTRPRQDRETLDQGIPPLILRQNRLSATINPQDQRGLFKVAEHDGDTAIRSEVGVRFVPRSAKVQIGNTIWREHSERIITFGAKVDPPIFGGGGDEKDGLLSIISTCLSVKVSVKSAIVVSLIGFRESRAAPA